MNGPLAETSPDPPLILGRRLSSPRPCSATVSIVPIFCSRGWTRSPGLPAVARPAGAAAAVADVRDPGPDLAPAESLGLHRQFVRTKSHGEFSSIYGERMVGHECAIRRPENRALPQGEHWERILNRSNDQSRFVEGRLSGRSLPRNSVRPDPPQLSEAPARHLLFINDCLLYRRPFATQPGPDRKATLALCRTVIDPAEPCFLPCLGSRLHLERTIVSPDGAEDSGRSFRQMSDYDFFSQTPHRSRRRHLGWHRPGLHRDHRSHRPGPPVRTYAWTGRGLLFPDP